MNNDIITMPYPSHYFLLQKNYSSSAVHRSLQYCNAMRYTNISKQNAVMQTHLYEKGTH